MLCHFFSNCASSPGLWRIGTIGLLGSILLAQNPTELERNRGVGDSPDVELSKASDLRLDLTHDAIRTAMRKVADWQLERARPYFKTDSSLPPRSDPVAFD